MCEEFDDIYLFVARFTVRHHFENWLRPCQLVEFNETLLSTATYLETHTMYVQRNIEALSLNHCCVWKAIIITGYESVFEALGIQHANHMRHIVISCLLLSTIFFHIIL